MIFILCYYIGYCLGYLFVYTKTRYDIDGEIKFPNFWLVITSPIALILWVLMTIYFLIKIKIVNNK